MVQARNIVVQTTSDIDIKTTGNKKLVTLNIPRSGKYLLTASGRAFRSANNAGTFFIVIQKNGSSIINQAFNWSYSGGITTARNSFLSRTIQNLKAGDVVDLYFNNDTSATEGSVSTPAVLSAELVG